MFVVSQFVLKEEASFPHYSLLLSNLGSNIYGFQVRLQAVVSGKPYVQPLPWFEGKWEKGVVGQRGEFRFSQVGSTSYASDSLIPVLPEETVRIDLRLAFPFLAEDLRTVTGYVALSIPLVEQEPGSLHPQGDEPVPILVNPFRDRGTANYGDISTPIAISSGKAMNEITPEQPQTWELPTWNAVEEIGINNAEADQALAPASDTAVFIESPESVRKVLSYVAYLGQSTTNIDRFNEMLREAGHDLRLASD